MNSSQPWIVDCDEANDPLDLEFLETDNLETSQKQKESEVKVNVDVKSQKISATKEVKKRRVWKKRTCPICGRQIRGHGYLKFHLKKMHKSEWETEIVETLVQLDHNYCAKSDSSDVQKHSIKKDSKLKNAKKTKKDFIKKPNRRKDSQKRSYKKRTNPEHNEDLTNQVDAKAVLDKEVITPEHVGESAEKVCDVIEEPICVICPKVLELNEFVQTVLTRQDLIEMEPYHCVSCSKRFTWDWIDLDSLDYEDLISTNMLDPDIHQEGRIETEILSSIDTDLTDINNIPENPVNNKVTPPLPKKKKLKRRKKEEMFECQFCQRKFKLKLYVKDHIRRVHEKVPIVTPFQCNVCQRYLSDKSALNKHIRIMHEVPEDGFECNFCEEKFPTYNRLKMHIRMVHKKSCRIHCEICNLEFQGNGDLNKHNRRIHNIVQTIPCKLCKEVFSSHKSQKCHMRSNHEKFYRNECEFCENKYSCATTLWTHIFKVHQKLEPYQCEQCGQKFTRLSILKQHQRLAHEGFKPYQCHICGNSFPNNFLLQSHVVKKHSEEKVRPDPIECALCHGVFQFRKNYVKHMEIMHNPDPEKRNGFKKAKRDELKCDLCKLTFTSQRYLERHNETQKHALLLAKLPAISL